LGFSGTGLASGLNQVGLTPAVHSGKKGTLQTPCRMALRLFDLLAATLRKALGKYNRAFIQ
jgi:hypothetical protein